MRGKQGRSERRGLIVAIVAACALLLPAGHATAATLVARNTSEPTLVERMNDVRAAHGLRPLRVSWRLTQAATRHANSMGKKGYFRHELPKSSKWFSFGAWIRWYWPGPDYSSWIAGENLAWGAPDVTSAQTVTWWMNSPTHRANLLGNWKRVGVAVVHVTAPAGYYRDYPEATLVAAEFGRRSG